VIELKKLLDFEKILHHWMKLAVCQHFSRAYLCHLVRSREILAYTLLTIHNITELIRFTQRIRTAILSDRFTTEFAPLALPPQPKCNPLVAKPCYDPCHSETVLYRLKKDGSRTVVSKLPEAYSILDPW